MTHWHVTTGLAGYGPDNSDDDTWSTATNAQELAAEVKEYCETVADIEYPMAAQTAAENGDYKAAWLLSENSHALFNLAQGFDYDTRAKAPLYVNDPEALDDTMIRLAREHFPFDYNEGRSRIYVWECDEPDLCPNCQHHHD